MERNEIVRSLTAVFMDALDIDGNLVLANETTAEDVDGWDSLSHIQLVVAIEKHFHIRFTSKEIQSWKNVGELLNCIESKLKAVKP